jgi:uncharacterized membrane protein YphA (DoxX/SURF4 family)
MNTSPTVFPRTKSKTWNIILWILQILVAAMFLLAGTMKLTTHLKEIPLSQGMIYFIGLSEVLGGLGLILPSLLKIKPILTPVAAIGIVVIMILALGFHIQRGEMSHMPGPIIFGILAGIVAWGRITKAPIQSK